MHLYPQFSDYQPWLDFSFPGNAETIEPFFPELTQQLGWPKAIKASFGDRKTVLKNLGIQSGDYVILPNLSPIHWAEAVKALGADGILIDHDLKHWQIDLDLLEEFLMNYTMLNERDELILKKDSRTIKAIIIPHLLGGMCDMDRLAFIALRFNLVLGEDITQALGSSWNEHPAGSFGTVNFCDFSTNPILPFGPSVVFSSSELWVEHETSRVFPADILAHELGRQLIPQVPHILTDFQKQEATYRECSTPKTLKWMSPPDANKTNGLSAAFIYQEALSTIPLPMGRLSTPLYLMPPFDKCLYIRRENWSAELFETVKLLPLGFGKNALIEETKAFFSALER